jgi:hypothetical protein
MLHLLGPEAEEWEVEPEIAVVARLEHEVPMPSHDRAEEVAIGHPSW